MKYLARLACCAFILHLLAQETAPYEAYAGYYGIATMKARECTVVALNPFKLDLPQKSK